MARQRLTRKAEQDKQASPPPQMPAVDRTESPASPAYYPDPDADKYKSGDTSSWAEDPHKPMEPESPPPAMPGNLTTEDLDHPATSDFQKKPETPEQAMAEGGGGGKQAADGKQASLKQLAETRASLCVRIATAMMPNAPTLEVEEHAVKLMDLDDAKLKAAMEAFNVIAGDKEDKEFQEGEESEGTKEWDEEKEGGKKAAVEITARLEKVEGALGRVVKAMGHFFGMEDGDGMSDKELMAYLMAEDMDGDGVDQNKADYGYSGEKGAMEEEMEEEEAMLRAMLEEMDDEMAVMASGKEGADKEGADKDASAATESTDPLAKGGDVQSGEGGNVNPDPAAHTPVVAQSDGSDKKATEGETNPADNDIEITAGADPMGLMEPDKEASAADDELMALYADVDLPKTAGEEEEEMEEESKEEPEDADAGTDEKAEEDDLDFGADDEKKGGKKAAEGDKQRPQPKTKSAGAQQLGNVAGMPKAARDEVAELQKIWASAPDVASVFGLPSGS